MCGHAGQLFFGEGGAGVPAKRMCRLIGGDTSKRDGAASWDSVVGGVFLDLCFALLPASLEA